MLDEQFGSINEMHSLFILLCLLQQTANSTLIHLVDRPQTKEEWQFTHQKDKNNPHLPVHPQLCSS